MKKLSQSHIFRIKEVEELQETVMNYDYPSIVLFYDLYTSFGSFSFSFSFFRDCSNSEFVESKLKSYLYKTDGKFRLILVDIN
jgi:hypothetical protein